MAVEVNPPPAFPPLSICILTWNTRDLLEQCLASICADPQARDWQILVVDNASTDGSAAMVSSRFPQVELILAPANLGFSRGNNLALERARGQYLLLLNPDTQVEPGALGRLVAFMQTRKEAGAVGPMLLNADGSLQLSCGITPSLWTAFIDKLLLHKLFPFFKLGHWNHREIRSVGWVTGACLLVRRQVVEEVGPLDPEIFMFYEDLDWCIRIRQADWRIFYYPFSRVVHLGGQSTRKNRKEMLVISQRSLFYLFQKHFGQRQLFILRLLTVGEMILRSVVWSSLFILLPARRDESWQRLQAYRDILLKSLAQRSYWAPVKTRTWDGCSSRS